MRVGVIGTGYVGLVSAACFSHIGHEVVGNDIDPKIVSKLQGGESTIFEDGLQDLIEEGLENRRLRFTTSLSETVLDAEVVFLAVPTPEGDDGSADLRYVVKAATDLGPLLTNYTVVVNKSTVPVGTVPLVRNAVGAGATVDFDVISNPEFLREGYAVDDFLHPDRVVIGTDSDRTRPIMEDLYERLVRNDNPIDFVLPASAEMGKYASNAFLATKISFINFMSQMCEEYGADVEEVARIMGQDKRIGRAFLNAGIGWGGSCFPKDVQALLKMAKDAHVDAGIVEQAVVTNGMMRRLLPQKVKRFYNTDDLRGKRFALLGLAFKENTDDVRDAPSIDIVRDLTEAGAEMLAYDPQARHTFEKKMKALGVDTTNLKYAETAEEALTGTDAIIGATLWPEFSTMDMRKVLKLVGSPVVFDGRHIWKHPERLRKLGFKYVTIGKESDTLAA